MEGLRLNEPKNCNINRELWTTVVPNLVNIWFVIYSKNEFKIDKINVYAMGFQAFPELRLNTFMLQIVSVPTFATDSTSGHHIQDSYDYESHLTALLRLLTQELHSWFDRTKPIYSLLTIHYLHTR